MNTRFCNLVRLEGIHAHETNPPIASLHEGYAILLEELDELWDEVRKKAEARDPKEVLKELVQIGAMAQRVAEDVLYFLDEE